MGKAFKKVDLDDTITYVFNDDGTASIREPNYDGDDSDWIRVRASLTKSEANQLLYTAPTGERDIKGGLEFLERFFQKVIVAWSFTEDGEPIPPTLEAFKGMDAAGAHLIEDQLGKHLNRVLGREVAQLEGESES